MMLINVKSVAKILLVHGNARASNKVFYKCPNNDQNDPTTCDFYWWETEYIDYLQNLGLLEGAVLTPYVNMSSSEMSTLELKKQISVLAHELGELKQQQMTSMRAKMDEGKKGVVMDSACVVGFAVLFGCMLGTLAAQDVMN